MKSLTNYLVTYQVREKYDSYSEDFISVFFDDETRTISFLNELYLLLEDWQYFVFHIFSIKNGKIIQNNELSNNIRDQFAQSKQKFILQQQEEEKQRDIEWALARKKEIQDKKELYLSWLKTPDDSLNSKKIVSLKLKIDNLLSLNELTNTEFNIMVKPYSYRGIILKLKNKNKNFEWWYTTIVENSNFSKIDTLLKLI